MTSIVVLKKDNLTTISTTQNSEITLNQTSIVQIGVSKENISSIVRSGNQAIITLKNGEKIVIENFFNEDGTTSNSLAFPTEEGRFDIVEFDREANVINYNPVNSLTEIATSDQWVLTNYSRVSPVEPTQESVWFKKEWIKPLLIALGAEAVYLAAFKSDDKKGSSAPDLLAPEAPKAELDSEGKSLKGTSEPGAKITVLDFDEKVIGEGTADSEGNFNITINPPLINGERAIVYAEDAAGNSSNGTVITGTKDTIAPDTPVAQFNEAGSIVSGKTEPSAKVYLYAEDGKTLIAGPITAASDGTYAIMVSPPLAKDTQAKVIAEDAAGNPSESAIVIVGKDTIAPEQPKLEIKADGTSAKGTAEPNSTIKIVDAQNKVVASGVVNDKGEFEFAISPALKSDETFKLTAEDAAGNSSKPLDVKIGYDTIAPQKVVAEVSSDGKKISGQAEPNNKIEIRDKDNALLGTGQADSEGKFEITLNKVLSNNNTATIYSFDASNNRSPDTVVMGALDTIAPNKVVLKSVTDNFGDQKGTISNGGSTDDLKPIFEGTGEIGATVTIYDKGVAITTTLVGTDGKWKYTPDSDLSLGDHSFSFTQTDLSKNTSAMSDSINFKVLPPTSASAGDTVNLEDLTGGEEDDFVPTELEELEPTPEELEWYDQENEELKDLYSNLNNQDNSLDEVLNSLLEDQPIESVVEQQQLVNTPIHDHLTVAPQASLLDDPQLNQPFINF